MLVKSILISGLLSKTVLLSKEYSNIWGHLEHLINYSHMIRKPLTLSPHCSFEIILMDSPECERTLAEKRHNLKDKGYLKTCK